MLGWTPAYHYWPVVNKADPAKVFQIGDGGFIEDTGLLNMLQRRVPKTATFIFPGPGEQIPSDITDTDYCALAADGSFDPTTFKPLKKIADSIHVLYGDDAHNYGYDDGQWHKSHNHVFHLRDMFPLACELQKLKIAGKPMVHKHKHKYHANSYWGITPGEVEIIWNYADVVMEFQDLLPADTNQALSGKSLKGFPVDIPAGLYMNPRQINLMAAQAEYGIMKNRQLYADFITR